MKITHFVYISAKIVMLKRLNYVKCFIYVYVKAIIFMLKQ